MDLQTIPLNLIDPDPEQPRRHFDELEDQQLALSIRERRLLQPLIIYRHEGRYRIVDGHRRFKALGLIQALEAPAIVLPERPDDNTLLETQLTANCLRCEMTPLDKARAYQRLMQSRGWNHSELASHLHIAKSSVTRCLSCLKLPTAAQSALQRGELSESTAYAIARAPDPQTQQTLLAAAQKGELKRDDAQRTVRKRTAKAAPASPRKTKPYHSEGVWRTVSNASRYDSGERALPSAGR